MTVLDRRTCVRLLEHHRSLKAECERHADECVRGSIERRKWLAQVQMHNRYVSDYTSCLAVIDAMTASHS